MNVRVMFCQFYHEAVICNNEIISTKASVILFKCFLKDFIQNTYPVLYFHSGINTKSNTGHFLQKKKTVFLKLAWL